MASSDESGRVRLADSTQSDEAAGKHVRAVAAQYCDACGSEMRPMGHCKYWCLVCGFLRTCNDLL
ncbi:MAG: hypothetical protein ACLQU2_31655 [Candidatus Binataceae bacterium]